MKHELRKIVELFHSVPTGEEHPEFTKAFSELQIFCESLPDGELSAPGVVSTADFKYAKMQTVHQLLVNTVARPTHTDAQAVELARLVDAAYGAIDAPAVSKPTSSPASGDKVVAGTVGDGDFADALIWLQDGKTVSRAAWKHTKALFFSVEDQCFRVTKSSGAWVPDTAEMLAIDWYVLS